MRNNIFFRVLVGLVLIAAIAGIAVLAYNAGAAHNPAISPAPNAQSGTPAFPVYGWWPFPFFGFGFFGLLAVFFLFWIVFGALRFIVWGPRFGWRRMHRMRGYWGDEGSDEDIPPRLAEMHRRMHAADQDKPAGTSTDSQK